MEPPQGSEFVIQRSSCILLHDEYNGTVVMAKAGRVFPMLLIALLATFLGLAHPNDIVGGGPMVTSATVDNIVAGGPSG